MKLSKFIECLQEENFSPDAEVKGTIIIEGDSDNGYCQIDQFDDSLYFKEFWT